MPRPEKVAIVESTKEAAGKASSIVLVDFTGLSVEEVTELRSKLREKAIDYRVVKNTLAKRSLESLGYADLLEYLEGPTAFAFGYDEPNAPVREILDFSKKREKPKIKALWLDGHLFRAEEARKIADLPPREQLIANFVGGLNAPITKFVGALNGILLQLVRTVAAVQAKKESEQAQTNMKDGG